MEKLGHVVSDLGQGQVECHRQLLSVSPRDPLQSRGLGPGLVWTSVLVYCFTHGDSEVTGRSGPSSVGRKG